MSRRPINRKFGQQVKDETLSGVHPTLLKQARKSGQLNLSNRQLEKIPDTVWRINLDVPEESRNVDLGNTDERWWDQVDLTKLILASNLLTELSDDINLLPALAVLDVHDNRIPKLPEVLGSLVHLQRLNVSHNELVELPSSIGGLQVLQSLHVEHNKLTKLPTDVCNLTSLEELDISNNQLTALPEGIGNLRRVMKLNMSHNHIHLVPHELGNLSNLMVLDCTHNQIHSLPDEIGDCGKLEQLYLRHNRLTHLPVIHTCASLKELHLGNNQLQGFTAEHLEGLRGVHVLDLRDNRLTSIPDEITILEQLERLDLTNNDISRLPYALGGITSLKSVVLDGNPMKGIRRDIIMRGTQELKKYLLSRIETKEEAVPVVEVGGQSGLIGASGETVDPHHVAASKSLEYSGKKVREIPAELWPVAEQGEVTSVNFSKNMLVTIPQQLFSLKKSLSELNLGFNKIAQLDPDIAQLSNLLLLDVRNNELSSLPEELGSLPLLRELNISCNRFRQIPPIVYKLQKLEIILAGDNQIEAIDAAGLKLMGHLSCLDLRNNNISQVPPALGLCEQIRSLQLEGNPFRVPRPAIVTKGTGAILEYLKGRIPSS